MTHRGSCRFCATPLRVPFADLGMSPLSNSYLKEEQLNRMEPFYPLHAWVCESCLLVQLEQFESPAHIFSDYAYFSSFSDSWLEHARNYAEETTSRFKLTASSLVIEVASNDGYLLQYFSNKGIPVLGIEPAINVAAEAVHKGIKTLVKFFGAQLAAELSREGKKADLLIGNNVIAHVPDLNDFVAGLALLLKPSGILSVEFPHLLCLMQNNQFDTIYHEHFSYFSLLVIEKVFSAHGLVIFDVEELKTHGGSLRVFAKRNTNDSNLITDRVAKLRQMELRAGLDQVGTYATFAEKIEATKRALLLFLIQARESGKRTVGYGAPAKGNTLLNYCGIRTDLLEYTVDRSPHKQGRFLPGTHIPVHAPEMLNKTRPDYVLILPWNLQEEIMEQVKELRSWGCKFVVPIPQVRIVD